MATTWRRIKLSSRTDVGQYLAMVEGERPDDIIAFHRHRLHERYIAPVRSIEDPGKLYAPNGFALTALGCLLVETIESFHEGLGDSKGKSAGLFESFFQRQPEFEPFWEQWFDNREAILAAKEAKKPPPKIDNFYVNVRCGILHQGETKAGWLIRRRGCLLNPYEKTVNAMKFHYAVERALDRDLQALSDSPWKGTRWMKFKKKMRFTVDHTLEASAYTESPG